MNVRALIVLAAATGCNLVTGLGGYEKTEGSGAAGAAGGGGAGGAGLSLQAQDLSQIFAGPTGTCVLTNDYRAFCWGQYPGRAGVAFSFEPVAVELEGVVSIVMGQDHRCAQVGELDADGEVLSTTLYCWGDNARGQLGDGSFVASTAPVKVSGVDGVVIDRWSTGHSHVCAAEKDGGQLVCWGANNRGQLGLGSTEDSSVPVRVPVPEGGAGAGGAGGAGSGDAAWNGIVSVGLFHTCAIAQRNQIEETYCWGDNTSAQLAATSPAFSATPLQVDDAASLDMGFDHFDRVFCGGFHTCARSGSTSKRVFCWGANESGQLGDGSTIPQRATPGFVEVDTINTLYAGARHNCVSLEEATGEFKLLCWGANDLGQSNVQAEEFQSTPIEILHGEVKNISSAKGDHACVIDTNDDLVCWGRNDFAQLGLGFSSPFEREPQIVIPGTAAP
jgi:alpha-tubulin suppressor-like RCC1 family protein